MTLDWWFTTELIYIMWQFKGDKIEKKKVIGLCILRLKRTLHSVFDMMK